MTPGWLHAYLAVQLLVLVGWALTLIARRVLDARETLRLSRLLLLGAVGFPVLIPPLLASPAWRPATHAWAALDRAGAGPVVYQLRAASRHTEAALDAAVGSGWWVAVPTALLGAALVWAVLTWLELLRIVRRAAWLEHDSGLDLMVSDDVSVPFAAWMPGRRVIVLDRYTHLDAEDRRVAIAHERQHHRNRDVAWAYLLAAARAACLFNPAVHMWARTMAELEEFACDAEVLQRGEVSPKAYGRSLVRAAERARGGHIPVYAVAMTQAGARSLLYRRIQALGAPPRRTAPLAPVALLALSLLGATAVAAEVFLDDVGLSDVAMATYVEKSCEMQVPNPDEPVLRASLLELAGTRRGLSRAREDVARASSLLAAVSQRLVDKGLPRELVGVAMLESSFRSDDADGWPRQDSVGLWGLSPASARAYGLTVDGITDERLDPLASTDAAGELFVQLFNEFGDWGLAIAAYHQGSDAIHTAIRQHGSRDPWRLVAEGAIATYAADAIAASLLLLHPETMDLRDAWMQGV